MTSGIPRAAVVLSGNELLDGRTTDTNGAFVSADLSARGAKVTSILTVADDPERLSAALHFSFGVEPELLVIGGGLGTTHDDLTAACLAEATGRPLVEHPAALAMVEERVRMVAARRGLVFDDVFAVARRQALLPAGAEPVPPAGVAPGISLLHGRTRIFALPGVPHEFEAMWSSLAERLQAAGAFPETIVQMARIFGAGELQVAPLLDRQPRDLLETGINVGAGEVTVRLRHPGTPQARRQAAAVLATLQAEAPVFSIDGRTVDELVADALRSIHATVAVAESCTGGLLGGRFTSAPGSSDYFVGGVISYANEVKTGLLRVPVELLASHGAVSAQVAEAMASGARAATGATYGLAVTGVAGPDGGTPDKPVGLVYIACDGPAGVRSVRNHFPGDRAAVREYSVTAALHLLLAESRP